jgi:hypothetical protein
VTTFISVRDDEENYLRNHCRVEERVSHQMDRAFHSGARTASNSGAPNILTSRIDGSDLSTKHGLEEIPRSVGQDQGRIRPQHKPDTCPDEPSRGSLPTLRQIRAEDPNRVYDRKVSPLQGKGTVGLEMAMWKRCLPWSLTRRCPWDCSRGPHPAVGTTLFPFSQTPATA